MSQNKRVTLDLSQGQHKKLKDGAKTFGITQQDLLALMVDLTLTNLDTIRPHAAAFKRRKDAEAAKQAELAKKAASFIDSLTPEQQQQLLAGKLNMSDL